MLLSSVAQVFNFIKFHISLALSATLGIYHIKFSTNLHHRFFSSFSGCLYSLSCILLTVSGNIFDNVQVKLLQSELMNASISEAYLHHSNDFVISIKSSDLSQYLFFIYSGSFPLAIITFIIPSASKDLLDIILSTSLFQVVFSQDLRAFLNEDLWLKYLAISALDFSLA
jgi:hypothetical protein